MFTCIYVYTDIWRYTYVHVYIHICRYPHLARIRVGSVIWPQWLKVIGCRDDVQAQNMQKRRWVMDSRAL